MDYNYRHPYITQIIGRLVSEGVTASENLWHKTTIKDLAGNDRPMGIYQGHTITTKKAVYTFTTNNFLKKVKPIIL